MGSDKHSIRRHLFLGLLLGALWLLALSSSGHGGLRGEHAFAPLRATPTPSLAPSFGPPTPSLRKTLTIVDFRVHPDGPLYEGDRLSFEVEVRNTGSLPLNGARMEIWRGDGPGSEILAEALLPELAPGASHRTVWTWVWEARPAGSLSLIAVTLPPEGGPQVGDSMTRTIFLRPEGMLPEAERQARWAQAESRCCQHIYLTGTAAERDLPQLMAWADEAEATVRARLGFPAQLSTYIVWIPRLLGQGGFAVGDSLILTYPLSDRLPADLPTILRHELTHRMTCAWLEREECLAHLPSFVIEGMAVFVAGGHYRPEPLTLRAAALLHMGQWISLDRLVEGFYTHPHEISYLEAGAFIEELVREGGWPRFRAFLRAMERRPGETDREVLDRALRAVYHQSIQGMEAQWLEHLRGLPADPDQIADLQFTVAFYEALRAYQRTYDPSTYFLGAWLPDWREAVRKRIVADFMREPEDPKGRWFWRQLQDARERASTGDLQGAWKLLLALCESWAKERGATNRCSDPACLCSGNGP